MQQPQRPVCPAWSFRCSRESATGTAIPFSGKGYPNCKRGCATMFRYWGWSWCWTKQRDTLFCARTRRKTGERRTQIAAAGRPTAAVVSGQPAARVAAQEARRVRRGRRDPPDPRARRYRRPDKGVPARRQQRSQGDRPDRDPYQQDRRPGIPAPAEVGGKRRSGDVRGAAYPQGVRRCPMAGGFDAGSPPIGLNSTASGGRRG